MSSSQTKAKIERDHSEVLCAVAYLRIFLACLLVKALFGKAHARRVTDLEAARQQDGQDYIESKRSSQMVLMAV
jgi:hypothetical protein